MNKKLIKAAVIGALFSVAPMSFAADEVEDIKAAARMYANSTNAGIYYAMGVTQHSNGTNHVKSIANLAMLTGNVGTENRRITVLDTIEPDVQITGPGAYNVEINDAAGY